MTVTVPASAATIRPAFSPWVIANVSTGATFSSTIVIVRSETDPTTAFVGVPRVITTVSDVSTSASALTVIVTIPLVPALITIESLTVKSPEFEAVPPTVRGTVTG